MWTILTRRYVTSFRGLPASAWWIAFALFVNRTGSMALTFLALYVTEEFHFSPRAAAALLTVYGVGAMCSALIGGRCVSRFGALPVLIMSLIGNGVAMMAVMSVTSERVLYVAVILWSLVAEAARPAAATAVSEVTPEPEQSRALTLVRLAENLGTTFGPAIGGFLAEFNFRLLFAVDALTCWGAAILIARLARSFVRVREDSPLAKAIGSPFRDRIYVLFLLCMIGQAIVLFQLLGTYQLYLTRFGRFTPLGIGILFAINTIMIVTMEMPLLHALRDVSRLRLVAVGSCIFCLGFALLACGTSWALVILSTVIWTIGEMISFSPATAFASQRGGSRLRGRYLGALTGSFSLAFLLAPQIGMRVYEWNPLAVWWSAMVVGPLLGGVLWWLNGVASARTVFDDANESGYNRSSADP